MSKEEYEDIHNEKIVYCKKHHSYYIDGCPICDNELKENDDREE